MSKENEESIPVTSGKEGAKTALSTMRPIADMERLFERFFGRGWSSVLPWQGGQYPSGFLEVSELRIPSLDVIDRDNEILVRAALPGIDKKDLDISLTENLLTIKGQSSSEKKEEKGDYYRREISSATFARSVTLPSAVDSSKANANLKDGILEITLPKMETSKRRSISVA